MGVTICCKKTHRAIDMGYGGFMNLRRKVAELCGQDILEHYDRCLFHQELYLMSDTEKSQFWKSYDEKTAQLVQEKKLHTKVADFLYQTDAGGSIRYGACKELLKIIGSYDDDVLYGYAGKTDCAKFCDFKAILKDCVETKSDMVWL